MSFAAPHGLSLRNPTNRRIEMTDTTTSTRITQLGTVMVPVSDQDRAIEFYLEKLGIETRVGFTTEDVDADHAHLQAQGVDVDEVMRMGDPVPPMLFFRDPDGNRFMIVERS
jgi:catechol 2,3-dioxygenase-like lactoylglutathione lyase family enzyme